MKNLLIALALAAPLTFASVGNAAPSTTNAKKATAVKKSSKKLNHKASKCAKAKAKGKACNVTFGVHDIKGDKAADTGENILAKLQARFGGLIKFRAHFNDKILKAADGI